MTKPRPARLERHIFPKGTFLGRREFKAGESIYWEDFYTQYRAMPWGILAPRISLVGANFTF